MIKASRYAGLFYARYALIKGGNRLIVVYFLKTKVAQSASV